MKIFEFISEITKPVGAIYLRFKVRMADVPPNASREEKRKAMYLTAFTGFANDPSELTAANARLRFMKLTSMNDIVKMIKDIMADKTFISAKSMTIYMDLPNSAYQLFPYLQEFVSWVSKNGGDRIKIEWKPEGEDDDEEKLKKKRKPNPNAGLKQVDYDPADPRYTIHFTVSDRFYNAIRKNMPNLMQYKGAGQEFRMPKELFDKFRDAAQQRFGDIGLKVLKKAHTDESLEEGADKREKDNAIRNFSQDGKDTQKQNIKKQFGQKAANKAMKKRVSFLSKQTSDESLEEVSAELAKRAANKATYRGNDNTEMGDRDSAEKNYKKADKFNAYAKKKMKEEFELDERGAASRALCLSKKPNNQLGASQLASCKSQGLRAREGDKSHKFKDGKRVTVGGHKIKGAAHGGPLPDWGTRGTKKKK